MQKIARDKEPAPIRTIEDLMVKDPDRSKWDGFCGKYEHPEDENFVLDEVCMKEGVLWAAAIDEDGGSFSFRLYPIGEDEFGRKGGMIRLTFGDGYVTYNDHTCKKL